MKTTDCYAKAPIETGDQFLPEESVLKETQRKKEKVDWKAEMMKELKNYEREAFKPRMTNK